MTKKPAGTAPKEQFVKMPRGLMASDAWLSMRSGHLKIISALCEEHMRKGGRENGWLKMPHRQIVALGVGPRNVARLILELEVWGLIGCRRGGMRSPIRYALTWLPTADGKAPTNGWQSYRAAPDDQKSAHEREGSPAHEREGRLENLHTKGKADEGVNLHTKGKALSRRGSIPGGAEYSVLGVEPGAAPAAALPGEAAE